MNELAKQWVAELRSGKYKQAKRVLRTPDDEFCCLGVLCDIIDPERWGNEGRITGTYQGGGVSGIEFQREWESGFLPQDVYVFPPSPFLNLVGLSYEQAKRLAGMNDGGKSFEQIANKIEEFLS